MFFSKPFHFHLKLFFLSPIILEQIDWIGTFFKVQNGTFFIVEKFARKQSKEAHSFVFSIYF